MAFEKPDKWHVGQVDPAEEGRGRLLRELEKLDPVEERALAEEALDDGLSARDDEA